MTRRHASIVVPSFVVPSIVVLGLALLASACGSSANDAGSASPAAAAATNTVVAPATTAADQIGSLGDAVEVAAGAPAQANDAACVLDRQTLEAATEMYYTLNGADPASQIDLMDAGLIKELTPRFEITPEGMIVPAAGSPCT